MRLPRVQDRLVKIKLLKDAQRVDWESRLPYQMVPKGSMQTYRNYLEGIIWEALGPRLFWGLYSVQGYRRYLHGPFGV